MTRPQDREIPCDPGPNELEFSPWVTSVLAFRPTGQRGISPQWALERQEDSNRFTFPATGRRSVRDNPLDHVARKLLFDSCSWALRSTVWPSARRTGWIGYELWSLGSHELTTTRWAVGPQGRVSDEIVHDLPFGPSLTFCLAFGPQTEDYSPAS